MPIIGKGIGPCFGGGGMAQMPSILNDGNHLFFDYSKADSITKNVSNSMSAWTDCLGSGIKLLQATETSQPLHGRNGVYFNGTSRMKTNPFALSQPCAVYIVYTINNEIALRTLYDGNANSTMALTIHADTNKIYPYAGLTGTAQSSDKRSNNITRVLFNGANSKFYHNGTDIDTSLGTSSAGGFTLGGRGVSTSYNALMIVKAVIISKILDTAEDDAIIIDYLKRRFGKDSMPGKLLLAFDDISTPCYDALAGLARYGTDNLKGSFFINGKYMDDNTAGYCTTAQVQALAAAGHDIQCHGYRHLDFTTLTQEQLLKNITDNDDYFSRASLPAPLHVAYPFGYANAQVTAWLAAQGKRLSGRTYYDEEVEISTVSKTDDKLTINGISTSDIAVETQYAKIKEAADNGKAVVMVSHGWAVTHYALIAMARLHGCQIITISELYNWMNS